MLRIKFCSIVLPVNQKSKLQHKGRYHTFHYISMLKGKLKKGGAVFYFQKPAPNSALHLPFLFRIALLINIQMNVVFRNQPGPVLPLIRLQPLPWRWRLFHFGSVLKK